MNRDFVKKLYILIPLLLLPILVSAAPKSFADSTKEAISQTLTRIVQREVKGVPVRVSNISQRSGKVVIYTSVGMSYYPVREDNLAAIYDSVRLCLPNGLRDKKIEIVSEGYSLDYYIPLYDRTSRKGVKPFTNSGDGGQLVRPERPFSITKGLADRHIAMWQSHGRYFDEGINDWTWQRSLLWQTVEDLYTQSYVLPYLVPMLESAGATVLLPRERDFQTTEIIIDNDSENYTEKVGKYRWQSIEDGFAHRKTTYLTGENPFADGTSRATRSVSAVDNSSVAKWSAAFQKSDDYAVYVSYKSFPDSADGVVYTVHHAGGESRYHVNQRMGGGTWIYLGTHRFTEGEKRVVVTLSNLLDKEGAIVSADAVKIGGGYGNIARTVRDSLQVAGGDYTPITSGMPRYCEGARYWLQWAGFDEKVYSPNEEGNDYKDDYMSRGEWVNALMGGSERLKKEEGLAIPIDLSFAFHTDAGITDNDATIGTLGIFYTKFQKGKFEGGAKRYLSRDLTDLVMSQISDDLRRTYEPEWRRRGMWNRSYYEARVPSTPTMLLELLSHQNLADMRLGHDPNFKFTVARAIYKAMLRHLSAQYDVPYCVTPLPVKNFSTSPIDGDGVRLSWQPTVDSLESSAAPTAYVVYTRKGNGGFDSGRVVTGTEVVVRQSDDIIYSYRVTAINAGGESFPSETLAVCRRSDAVATVMVVNGFDRLSAPECREDGFHNEFDSGVAYIRDVAFVGEQRVYDTSKRREKVEQSALGYSFSDYQGGIVGGNTFDYPYLHGESLVAAGCSFYSSSVAAVESGNVDLSCYNMVDLLLGKQRTTTVGRGVVQSKYECFSDKLQSALAAYLDSKGALFVSGAYIGTDLLGSDKTTDADREFAKKSLHLAFVGANASRKSVVTTISRQPSAFTGREYHFCRDYRPDYYTVNSVDGFRAVGAAKALIYYPDSRIAAAVGYKGDDHSTFVMSLPFESVTERTERDLLMKDIVEYLIH